MTRVTAPTRLHFGLLNVPTDQTTHQFGGCGLMLQAPRVEVRVQPASEWSASGPHADRALRAAQLTLSQLPGHHSALRVTVESCPPAHTGLGVGTALALAVARAVASEAGQSNPDAVTLATWTQRGERSAVGTHGSELGGFLVDGGKSDPHRIGTLLQQLEFPDWPVVLASPSHPPADAHQPWTGQPEQAAFARPRDPAQAARHTDRLCQLLTHGIMSALVNHDHAAFAEALTAYNRAAGEPFALEQGGPYCSPAVENLVQLAHTLGAAAGQSSWGPTMFAICRNPDHARQIMNALQQSGADVQLTHADNQGSTLTL